MATLATFGLNVTLGDGDRFCLRETDVFVLAEAKIVQAAQRDGGDPGGLRNVAVASLARQLRPCHRSLCRDPVSEARSRLSVVLS